MTMKAVLYMRLFEDSGITKLQIFKNKKEHLVELPFKPYFFDSAKIDGLVGEEVILKPVDTLQPTKLFKYEVDSVKDIPKLRTKTSIAADVNYLLRLCIDQPSFLNQYFQTDELTFLYLDIETDSIGIFPKPELNPIISIGYAINDGPVKVIKIDKLEDGDIKLLLEFNEVMEKYNPDVIVGYNILMFDLPYILKRMKKNGISTDCWTRGKTSAFFTTSSGNEVYNIQGRFVFDVIKEVFQDQTIHGISKGLKPVSKYFKVDEKIRQIPGYEDYQIITEDVHITRPLIGTDKLAKYNESDVLITRELCKMYIANVIAFAEMLHAPLNMMAKRTTSMIGSIFYATELKKKGIIECTMPNYKRHPDVFGTLKEGY